MKLLLAFLPFIAFAAASLLGHTTLGLVAGTVIAAGTVAWDGIAKGSRIKLLDVGTFVLFGALTLFIWLTDATLSIALVRACVDIGLSLLVVGSVLIGRPFTLDYAPADANARANPRIMRTHSRVALAWAAAFALAAAADIALWFDVIRPMGATAIIVGSLYAAFRFTRAYPHRARQPS